MPVFKSLATQIFLFPVWNTGIKINHKKYHLRWHFFASAAEVSKGVAL